MLEINNPFDVIDPAFTESLRRPEALSNETKLYSQLGIFATIERLERMRTVDGYDSLKTPKAVKDCLRYGAWLCKEVGIPDPSNQRLFQHKMSAFDSVKVKWGLSILSALQVNEIAEQAWNIDRVIGMHHTLTKWKWVGQYDHRVAHPSDDPNCRVEHELAFLGRSRAAFDKSITEMVRNKLWEDYWGHNKVAPHFSNTVGNLFQQIQKKREKEMDAVARQEKADADYMLRDDLTYQMVAKMAMSGIQPGRWI